MWPAALYSGLVELTCGWAELGRDPPKRLKNFSSSLNVTVGYLCVQSLPEWA